MSKSTGLGALAVDLADRLTSSGIVSTTVVTPDGDVEFVVQFDPHQGVLAAIRVGEWASWVVGSEHCQWVSRACR